MFCQVFICTQNINKQELFVCKTTNSKTAYTLISGYFANKNECAVRSAKDMVVLHSLIFITAQRRPLLKKIWYKQGLFITLTRSLFVLLNDQMTDLKSLIFHPIEAFYKVLYKTSLLISHSETSSCKKNMVQKWTFHNNNKISLFL